MASPSRTTIRNSYPLYFLAPALVIFTIFFIGPAIVGMQLSFTDATVRSMNPKWVGWDNYIKLFTATGGNIWNAIGNTLIYAVLVSVVKTSLGIAIALFLYMKFKGRNALRALIYMPIMFSAVVIGILFNYILKPDGPLNAFLKLIGLGFLQQNWLGSFDIALYSVVGVDSWVYVGWTVVIVLAALGGVPKDCLESADMDGAGPIRKFFLIRLPLIWGSVTIAFLLTIISGMKVFDLIYTTTGGGPGYSTQVISTFIAKSLGSGLLGFASAASVLQFVFISIISMIIQGLISWKARD